MNSRSNNSISIISHIHSSAAEFLERKLKEKGLSDFGSSHGNILFQLSVHNSLRMSELSKIINRDKSTTTVLIRKLLKDGLVKETTDPTDGRNKIISLTEKGMEYNKATSEISKQLIKTFYKGFSEEEKESFYSLLLRIENNFSENIK